MTLFINLRAGTSRALAREAAVFERTVVGPGAVNVEAWTNERFAARVLDRKLALVTHGFAVSYAGGVRSLGRVEEALGLGAGWTFVGVLWPGDSWLPFVNYPAEAKDAALAGRRLADHLNRWAARADSFAFASHSLGARVVLDAVQRLAWPSRAVCLTAAAADDDCLTVQYPRARERGGRISVLASEKDRVLQLAYPAGDLLSDITYDTDSPFRAALGRRGTRRPAPPGVSNFQIAPSPAHGHTDYFPGGEGEPPDAMEMRVMGHIGRWLRGEAQTWPAPAA